MTKQPSSLAISEWLEAPHWATHIVGFNGDSRHYCWAEIVDGGFYGVESRLDRKTPFPLLDEPTPEAFGWVIRAARPNAVAQWKNVMVYDLLKKAATGSHFLIREPRADTLFEPNEQGHWLHPDFRWNLVPDDSNAGQHFSDAGFEIAMVDRELEFDPCDLGCMGWTPEPLGDGWILVAVVDSEDDAQAVFARRPKN